MDAQHSTTNMVIIDKPAPAMEKNQMEKCPQASALRDRRDILLTKRYVTRGYHPLPRGCRVKEGGRKKSGTGNSWQISVL